MTRRGLAAGDAQGRGRPDVDKLGLLQGGRMRFLRRLLEELSIQSVCRYPWSVAVERAAEIEKKRAERELRAKCKRLAEKGIYLLQPHAKVLIEVDD